MMQLLCDGVFLDLYENSNVQFTQDNPLFAFDSLKCERTTQFKLPATPKNDRIFALARIPAYTGEGMRRKFDAQLIDGQVIKDGYLYVSSYDGKDYAAIFVTGELIGLQQIRDAGKIADFWHPAGSIVWSQENVKDANTYEGQQSLALTRYKTNDTPCHPSIDLSDVINYAYQEITGHGLTVPRQRGFRLIPKEIPALPKMSVTITYAGTGAEFDDSYEPSQYGNTMTISDGAQIVQQQDLVLLIGVGGTSTQWKYTKLHQFVARQNLIITFPSDFPSEYYLMSIEDKGMDGSNPEYNYLSPDWFLGGYSFHRKNGGGTASSGTPLAGRSVEIPSGTPFMILSDSWYEYQPRPLNWDGFRWINDSNYDLSGIVIEGKDIAVGDTVRAMDILPDLTLVELMKIYSYCVGKVLMYDETNGVSFDDLDFSSWPVVNISDKLTKRGEVARKFGDYAQHNVISFKSGNDVPVNKTISAEYTVDNDNLEASKDMAVIPYSEGSTDADGGYIVARFDAEDTSKHKLYADGIMVCGSAACGLRISLPKNAGLQALCDASTQIQVSARMTSLEYFGITAKTLLLIDGSLYTWTKRNWQKDVSNLTLAKIGVVATPQPILPYKYQQVEYIGTRDGARITINHIQTPNTTIEIEAARFIGGSHAFPALYTGYNNIHNSGITLYFSTSNNYTLIVRDTAGREIQLTNTPDTREWHKYKQTPLEFYIDDEQKMTYNQGTVNGGNIMIFYISESSRKWYGDATKITIKESDVITNELIPCYRKSDNVVGYYDITNDEFYTNDLGTGSLIAGPDVNP